MFGKMFGTTLSTLFVIIEVIDSLFSASIRAIAWTLKRSLAGRFFCDQFLLPAMLKGVIASNVQSNLPQAQVIFWNSTFRKNLKNNTCHVMICTRVDWKEKVGNTYVMFMYPTLPPNLVQTAEGTLPGVGVTLTPTQSAAVIGEYSDYATLSSRAAATAIDDTIGNIGQEMAYELGQTLSEIPRLLFDNAYTYDASARIQLPASSTTVFTTLSLNEIRTATQSMVGRAIPTLEGAEMYPGVIHGFVEGDVANDTSNNSPIDIAKHTKEGLAIMESFISADVVHSVEYPSSNAKFYRSNLVTQIANYQSVTGLTGLTTYLAGQDGVFAYDLKAAGDTSIGDGDYRGIDCFIERNFPRSAYDPAGVIPGAASYRCHFTASYGPDLSTARVRVIQAASAVS